MHSIGVASGLSPGRTIFFVYVVVLTSAGSCCFRPDDVPVGAVGEDRSVVYDDGGCDHGCSQIGFGIWQRSVGEHRQADSYFNVGFRKDVPDYPSHELHADVAWKRWKKWPW